MNNKNKLAAGLNVALGNISSDSEIAIIASDINVRVNKTKSNQHQNESLLIMVSAAVEQFIDTPLKNQLEPEVIEKIFNVLSRDNPALNKQQVNRQSVDSNELLRVLQGTLAAITPVLMCSEAEVERLESAISDGTSAKAKEQSYFLGRQAMDSAIKTKTECDINGDGLTDIGIVLSSISTLCLGSSSIGVSRETLVLGLLEIVKELVDDEIKATNPLKRLAYAFSNNN